MVIPSGIAGLLVLSVMRDVHVAGSTTYYCDCKSAGIIVNDDSGTIYSPNYGTLNGTAKTYPVSCSLNIDIVASSPMQILFPSFNMASGDYCQIQDLSPGNSYNQIFTGSSSANIPLLSKNVQMSFYSNKDTNVSSGYVMTWTTNYASLPTTQPPLLSSKVTYINVTGADGIIQSPNYPGLYTASDIVDWIITGPDNSQISLTVVYFYTEETRDYLKILDGLTLASESLIGDYSGDLRKNLPSPVVSSTSRLHLKFVTDATTRYNGFYIRCAVYDPNAIMTTAASTTQGMAIVATTTQSLLDYTSTVALAVVIPLIVVSAVVAGCIYVQWYQPRKQAIERREAAKHYAAMIDAYENQPGRPGTARPGTARPGTAGPGTARPGTAGPGTARPGTAGLGIARPESAARPQTAQPGSARLSAITLDAENSPSAGTAAVPRPHSGLTSMTGIQRPMTAAQRQLVESRLPVETDEHSAPPNGTQLHDKTRVHVHGGRLPALNASYESQSQRPPAQGNEDEASQSGQLSLASLVGTKLSARIKSPPHILVNDGNLDEESPQVTDLDDNPVDYDGYPNTRRATVFLPSVPQGLRKLPPLTAAPPLKLPIEVIRTAPIGASSTQAGERGLSDTTSQAQPSRAPRDKLPWQSAIPPDAESLPRPGYVPIREMQPSAPAYENDDDIDDKW